MKLEDRCPGKRIQEPTRNINGGDNGELRGILSAITTASLFFRACSRCTRETTIESLLCFDATASCRKVQSYQLCHMVPPSLGEVLSPGFFLRSQVQMHVGGLPQNINTNKFFVFHNTQWALFFGIVEKSCFFSGLVTCAIVGPRTLARGWNRHSVDFQSTGGLE